MKINMISNIYDEIAGEPCREIWQGGLDQFHMRVRAEFNCQNVTNKVAVQAGVNIRGCRLAIRDQIIKELK